MQLAEQKKRKMEILEVFFRFICLLASVILALLSILDSGVDPPVAQLQLWPSTLNLHGVNTRF